MTEADIETPALEAAEPTDAPQEPVETFDREYVEKLRRENAAYRTKAKQAAEAAEKARIEAERSKLDELERLKAEKADAERAAEEARAEARRTRHLVALADKVVDPEDALAIAERAGLVTDDGIDVDALLEAKPYLRKPTGGAVDIPGARTSKKPTLTPEDVKKMTPDEVNANWPAVQTALRR
jgi:hypothetical protein